MVGELAVRAFHESCEGLEQVRCLCFVGKLTSILYLSRWLLVHSIWMQQLRAMLVMCFALFKLEYPVHKYNGQKDVCKAKPDC